MFEMFQVFQSYVAISVFMLQVASGLFGYCICFTHILQVYVPNISSASDVCCIQMFYIASISCFKYLFGESLGQGLGAMGRGVASQGLADGARDVPGVLRTGRAHPHSGSWVSLT